MAVTINESNWQQYLFGTPYKMKRPNVDPRSGGLQPVFNSPEEESNFQAAAKYAYEKGYVNPGKIGFKEVAPLLAFAAPAAAAAGLFAGGAAGAGTASGTASGTAATYGAGTGYSASAGAASGTGAAAGTAAGTATKLGTLADLGSVGLGAASLLGGSAAAVPETPLPAVADEPEPVMPTVDSAAVARRRRRSIMAQMARRGRESTILTDPLGG